MDIGKMAIEIRKTRLIVMGPLLGSSETISESIEYFWAEFEGREYRHGVKL
jgi:hypothetical protein